MSKAKKSARFVYQLQTLLKVREIRERQEQDKFKEAELKAIEEKRKEDDLKRQETQAYEDLSERMSERDLPGLTEINMRKYHLENLGKQYHEQVKVRVAAEEAREAQREKLAQAMKEKKIIEKDREKTREAWKKLMQKEEALFLDDIASVGFVKKRRDAES